MAGAAKPNFLFITTDQQRWDAVGIHNEILKTPNMDRLAQEGMQFARAYPTNAICMPSRASMITGRSQRGHQVFNHDVNLSEAIPVLGDSLRDAGYATALIGKAHFKTADYEDVLPDQPPEGAPIDERDGLWHGPYYGFDYIDLHTGHAYSAGHWRIWLENNHPDKAHLWRRQDAISDSGAFESWKNALPAELHYTQWTANRTVDWLQRRDEDQQFFLWMSFSDPHKPFAPPKPYCDMYADVELPEAAPREDVSNKPPHYQWARDGKGYGGYNTSKEWDGAHFQEIVSHYYGLTTFIDDAMGQVFKELERQGLWENTHVVFTSDHGEGLKDHGIAAKPMMSYECVNRVPFFWKHPSVSSKTFEGVVTHLDLTPTFLDFAEADPLVGMEGRSMKALLFEEAKEHRDAVIVERISVIAGEVMKVKMLVTENWKLLHYGSADYGELYDVKNDPEDIHNLWDDPDYAAVRRQLTDRLLAELIDSELGDPALILRQKSIAGALRDQKRMEMQPEVRSTLEYQCLGNTKRRRGIE